MTQRLLKVTRTLVYEGPPDWMERQLAQGVKLPLILGRYGDRSIREVRTLQRDNKFIRRNSSRMS